MTAIMTTQPQMVVPSIPGVWYLTSCEHSILTEESIQRIRIRIFASGQTKESGFSYTVIQRISLRHVCVCVYSFLINNMINYRRERNYCRICWAQQANADFHTSSNLATNGKVSYNKDIVSVKDKIFVNHLSVYNYQIVYPFFFKERYFLPLGAGKGHVYVISTEMQICTKDKTPLVNV